MKLKFKNQDFQTDAVNTVADLFKEKANTTFNAYYRNRGKGIEIELL